MMHSAGLHHSEQRLPVNKKNDEIYQTFCKITTLGTNNSTGKPRLSTLVGTGLDGPNNNY